MIRKPNEKRVKVPITLVEDLCELLAGIPRSIGAGSKKGIAAVGLHDELTAILFKAKEPKREEPCAVCEAVGGPCFIHGNLSMQEFLRG